MKNFRRVLWMACHYRWTLVGAVLSALGVAMLWGGNIGAVFPFAKIVLEGKSIQSWVADEIEHTAGAVNDLNKQIEKTEAQLAAVPPEQQAKLESALYTLRARRENESLAHDSYAWAKPYLDRWLPNDAFQTL